MTAFSDDPNTSSADEESSASQQNESGGQMPQSSAQILLPIAVSTAVPLWVYEIYQRGGPTAADWMQRLPHLGRFIAAQGDHLLYRSSREGESAELFNALAEALALLSFVPGGVPFGEQRFDALQILTGFLGAERANSYIAQVRRSMAAKAGGEE